MRSAPSEKTAKLMMFKLVNAAANPQGHRPPSSQQKQQRDTSRPDAGYGDRHDGGGGLCISTRPSNDHQAS
jgi:hypothetical protein